jgi:dCMP deaminase
MKERIIKMLGKNYDSVEKSMDNQLKWDLYFLEICNSVGANSKCLSRKIGAVLVRDHSIISTGYNGPARGTTHCNERNFSFYLNLDNKDKYIDKRENFNNECPRKTLGYKSGQGLHLCQAGHAEFNSIVQAARNGISTKDTTLYCNCPLPCKNCCITLINAGIKRLVCFKGNDYDDYSRILLNETHIEIKEYNENEL